MRSLRFLTISILLVAAFAVAGLAQAPAAGVKVAVINTALFYSETNGIAKFKAGYDKLGIEFKTDRDSLTKLATDVSNLDKEIKAMQANKSVPVNQATLRQKAIQLDQMTKKLKFEQDDFNTRVQQRQQELLAPINKDVGEKIIAFSKSKGFDIVFDTSNLVRDGSVLYVKQGIDITADFIKYYNALPAGTAVK